jgi:hypothetical protein
VTRRVTQSEARSNGHGGPAIRGADDGGTDETPPVSDDAADSPSECRPFALLLVRRDSQSPNAEGAFMNVLSIDAEVLPRPS